MVSIISVINYLKVTLKPIEKPLGFGNDQTSIPSPPVPPRAADAVLPTASIPE
jgi:hypothetical protein